MHQYRAAYELCGTPYSDFLHTESDVGLRDTLMRLDTEMLRECERLYSNARTTAARLEKFNGLQAPSRSIIRRAWRRVSRPGTTATTCCRWPHRIGQARRSRSSAPWRKTDPSLRLVVAGDGTQRENVERVAHEAGVADRVTFLGRVDDDRADRALCRRAGRGLSAVRRRLRLRHARGVPGAQAGHHLRRFRRAERVRRRRHQRPGRASRRRKRSPRRSNRLAADRRARCGAGRCWIRGSRARITWDGVIETIGRVSG